MPQMPAKAAFCHVPLAMNGSLQGHPMMNRRSGFAAILLGLQALGGLRSRALEFRMQG